MTVILLQNNSRLNNKDGYGFYQCGSDKIFKDVRPPSNLLSLSDGFQKSGKNPIIAHVRMASATNKKLIATEYCHPFAKENIVLAHNGTLECNNEAYKDETKIDSQIFLDVLFDEYSKNKNMPESIINAYKNFTGKFAFLITDSLTGRCWAVRGTTAELHISYLDIVTDKLNDEGKFISNRLGYVINTNGVDLSFSLLQFQNTVNLMRLGKIVYSEPRILEANSIFELGKYVVQKTGAIKESYPIAKVFTQNEFSSTQSHYVTSRESVRREESAVMGFINKYSVDFKYIDLLCYLINNKGILQIHVDEFDKLADYLESKHDVRTTKEWKGLINVCKNEFDLFEIHKLTGLEFPYFINPYLDIRKAKRDIKLILDSGGGV
jgi:hypothetical protein